MSLSTSAKAVKREAVVVFLGIGANLGHPAATVNQAIQAVKGLPHCANCFASHGYASAPIDSGGPDYVNAVVRLITTLDVYTLLAEVQALELAFGRERPYPNAPRTLDIDLLLYGDSSIHGPRLQVPHPRMWQRAFVLLPLAELAPELVTKEKLASVADQRIQRID
jgi:2-amino-4-hydroxy-6-hydroxymethyldihydropteridine diphosphokinase